MTDTAAVPLCDTPPDPFWVFGYGSLIWDPGFPVAERELARLAGFHRSFCMWSIHYRGTVETPGLVLALDAAADGICHGAAYRVEAEHAATTLAELRARELISDAYQERWLEIGLQGGRRQRAVTYVVDREHEQYCGGLDLEAQAQIIARATGERGPNRDYLCNTAAHLRDLGLRDADMDWLEARVGALTALP